MRWQRHGELVDAGRLAGHGGEATPSGGCVRVARRTDPRYVAPRRGESGTLRETGRPIAVGTRLADGGRRWGRGRRARGYELVADDAGAGDPAKVLLDRRRRAIFPAALRRAAATQRRAEERARPAGDRRRRGPPARQSAQLASARRLRGARAWLQPSARGAGGTFAGMIERARPHRRARRDVIELMPVHPFDPAGGQLLGLHAAGVGRGPPAVRSRRRPSGELADLVAAVHATTSRCGSTSCSTTPPRATRRADVPAARARTTPTPTAIGADGTYVDDSGCGNDIDTTSAPARLVLEALDRLADLGDRRVPLRSRPALRHATGWRRQINGWARRGACG